MITAGWVILVLFAFGFGVLTGLYLGSHSVGTAKHRQPVSPRPVLMPSTPAEDTTAMPSTMLKWDSKAIPQEALEEFENSLQEKLQDPASWQVIREHYDTHSTDEEMENGHWEGLNGTLEPESEPKVLRPEETSSSLLGLSQGGIRPTGGLKPVFGETEHLKYDPEDYEEPLICQPCKRMLVKGETFWAVSLPEEGEGVFIPICDDCEAKSHG